MLDLATTGIGELTEIQRTLARAVALPDRVALATHNAHKLRELARICADWPVTWVTVDNHDPADFPDVEETGETYLENASLKARAVAVALGLPALADDSGIEVDALGGRPGPRSARFAGEQATDAREPAGPDPRDPGRAGIRSDAPGIGASPRSRCPTARVVHTEADCEGTLRTSPAGSGGFGYDPIFVPVGWDDDDGRADR